VRLCRGFYTRDEWLVEPVGEGSLQHMTVKRMDNVAIVVEDTRCQT